MAWNFRKSINLGYGLRANLSKHGIGYSAGVRGARVGISARKQPYKYIALPGGFYNRSALNTHEGFFSAILIAVAVILGILSGGGRRGRKHRDWS